MTNFDFLQEESKFHSFADVAVAAEKIIHIDAGLCAMNCRRAMEFAIKWMYSVDRALKWPYKSTLACLMSTEEFKDIVGDDICKRLDYIRNTGNDATHKGKKTNIEQAKLCLQNLHIFMDFVACCYAKEYTQREYDVTLIDKQNKVAQAPEFEDIDIQKLIDENKDLKEKLTARRVKKQQNYNPRPLAKTEAETRKLYIDAMLLDAGWTEGDNWLNEVKVTGMPTKTGNGRVDYVLYDDAHKPLAIVEAKKTSSDVAEGRKQAKLYADILEKQYGRRPIIFLTNGFETRIIDNKYPERKVSFIYSKRDLEKWFNLMNMRTSLASINVDREIAGRYYQEAAIKSVCEAFDNRNRRKALLVMATGSGKTRTVIALCKLLLEAGWVKNILFLADRNSLVTQAKRSFVNLVPDLSCTNLVEEKDNYNAHCVFSTYQTMIHCIDTIKDDDGKLFTCGHFDLVICDEAHRSIYNKYKDIFTYFDAPLVGLTATPKDEIDKNTYAIFDLEKGVPTYGYELAQAVKDGYLVDYLSVETQMNFIENGITYNDLSEEEKEEYEETFENEDGEIPERIDSAALNTWIFNEDTVKKVLHILMTDGLKINYGEKIGKTIIFAKNHKHAEFILKVFNKEYPHLVDYADVIDNHIKFSQKAIDDFSDPKKLPQIAISVDMLDTGIDVPEVLNLVFFKKVMSKAKFWQMIGRGTRLCPDLIDGQDKDKFYIFDFCGNFDFFRMSEGKATANSLALQGAIFNLEFQMAYKLQDFEYQTQEMQEHRKKLIDVLSGKVQELNRDNFAVRMHLKYVDTYVKKENYDFITYEDTLVIREELAPLIQPDEDEVNAVRFDALMYGIELAYLSKKKNGRAIGDLLKKVHAISRIPNIPEIQAKSDLLKKVMNTDYVERGNLDDLEFIRIELRNLMKYLPASERHTYFTHFDDDILSSEWRESELENNDLENYRAKAEYYVKQHKDNIVIAKLRTNRPLSNEDIVALERIMWQEIGTKQDYEAEYGSKPLGEFVREIVGLDMNAAKEAFAEFLNGSMLDSRQIYFVNQIVEYIVHNGVMKDMSVLQESPFTDRGSIVEVFTDMRIWQGIKEVIDKINANAVA